MIPRNFRGSVKGSDGGGEVQAVMRIGLNDPHNKSIVLSQVFDEEELDQSTVQSQKPKKKKKVRRNGKS